MWNEEDYKLLCKACDRALSDLRLERVAIPWLHILNEHPSNLVKYDNLVKVKFKSYSYGVKFFLRTILHFKKILKCLPEWSSSTPLPESANVVIVSHLLNESQLGLDNDFYFGDLPKALFDSGTSCIVVLKNQSCAGYW